MSLPFIDHEGNLPPSSELKKFGLLFDDRTQSLATIDSSGAVVPLDLSSSFDVSKYEGLGKPVAGSPSLEGVTSGDLNSLTDVVNHVYLTKAAIKEPLPVLNLPTNTIISMPGLVGENIFVFHRFNPLGESELIAMGDVSGVERVVPMERSMSDNPPSDESQYNTFVKPVGEMLAATREWNHLLTYKCESPGHAAYSHTVGSSWRHSHPAISYPMFRLLIEVKNI